VHKSFVAAADQLTEVKDIHVVEMMNAPQSNRVYTLLIFLMEYSTKVGGPKSTSFGGIYSTDYERWIVSTNWKWWNVPLHGGNFHQKLTVPARHSGGPPFRGSGLGLGLG